MKTGLQFITLLAVLGCASPSRTTTDPISSFDGNGGSAPPRPVVNHQLTGLVTDFADDTGIAATTVIALQGSTQIGRTATDANGSYRLEQLPAGAVKVEYNRIGYTPRPREETMQMNGKLRRNVVLFRDTASEVYMMTVAKQVDAKAKAAGGRTEDYLKQWNYIANGGVHPTFKTNVAKFLKSQKSPAAEIPYIKNYTVSAAPDKLKQTDMRFRPVK